MGLASEENYFQRRFEQPLFTAFVGVDPEHVYI
jgi:hypothetical protein